jgi:hypothetical protein
MPTPADALDRQRADLADALAPLDRLHADRLVCRRGCAACCVDELTVFEVEAERIRERHGALLAGGTPHPAGACAFLDDEGACRIYEDRPYVCRTQGYPLRWLDDPEDSGPVIDRRDICPLNETDEPITELPAEACWTLGPFEGRLATLQHASHGGAMRRVALRDLFRRR